MFSRLLILRDSTTVDELLLIALPPVMVVADPLPLFSDNVAPAINWEEIGSRHIPPRDVVKAVMGMAEERWIGGSRSVEFADNRYLPQWIT